MKRERENLMATLGALRTDTGKAGGSCSRTTSRTCGGTRSSSSRSSTSSDRRVARSWRML